MESWENKIWSDKMNSLQQLPESYSPNLSSKWEIIEAGLLPKKSSIPLWIRWSVAAAILACIFLTAITLNPNNRRQQGMMASIKKTSLHTPISIQKEQHTIITIPSIVKNNNVQKAAKPAPVFETAIIAEQDKPSEKAEFKIDPIIPAIDSASMVTDELAITIPQQETPKRTKRKTFQKDFNDGLLVTDTGYSKPAGQQFSFKFQLHTPSGDETQPSRRLQVKQVL